MRKKIAGVRRTVLLSQKRPLGHRVLIDFLREVEEGKIPETEAVKQLADAFERIVLDKADAVDALQLKLKKGRPRKTGKEQAKSDSRDAGIVRFIEQRIAADPQRGKVTRAVKQAAAKFGKETRHVWRIWEYRKSERHQTLKQAISKLSEITSASRDAYEILAREQPIIDAYAATLTPKKRAEFMDMDGRECYRIACAATRNSLTKK